IMAWMVRGNIMWQREGLKPPPQVREAVEDYRRSEDTIQDFLDECCDITDDPEKAKIMTETSTNIYNEFKSWWEDYHSKRPPSIQWFGRRMSKKFKKEKRKEGGVIFYYGVQLKPKEEKKEDNF
ncbi:MAG: hypothetical protein LC660_12250, partial [Desulfobacteraceae bacterium]|nr:hypothetical protein [Desulfobacteraceae bacterium]